MSFPTGVQTVTVTAPANGYRTLDGEYQQGTITLTPTVPEVVSAEHGIIAVGAVQFTLGASGSFTPRAVLPGDAEGFTPAGWTYRLDQQLTGETPRSYNVLIPASAGSVDLSTLVEVTASDGVVVSVPGGHGTPSDTVTPETTYGQAASAGVSTNYARGDHTHGTPALPTTGTTAGTYAAGDDSRITGALQKTQNLADLANTVTARTNLGLGTAATQNTSAFDNAGAAASAQAAAIADAAGKYLPLRPFVFDVTGYGAVGDGQVVADGAMTSGSAALACTTSLPFTTADVGKAISVKGAGPNGVTTLVTTIAGFTDSGHVTLTATAATSITSATVIWGTDDTAHIQAAIDAAEAYLAAGHSYARVYLPPRTYIVAGPLSNAKSGNGQLTIGVYPTTGNKPILEICGEGDGAAAVRHWEQTVPQHAGSCLVSLGVYASTTAQTNDINANGNPGVISGPSEGHGYGAAATFSNIAVGLKNLAILTAHSSFGLTYGAFNFFGCANAFLENVGWGTAGTVAGSSTDYTSPGSFATGLSIGGLLPAPGNNDLVVAKNISVGGGYTFALFCTEHLVCDRLMVLYCWSAICPVGSYGGSVGSVHAMLIESASVEACINEVYIVGGGSGGVGPIIDILQLSTESSTPNIAGNSQTALNSALGKIKLTGLFTEAGVSTQYPTGIEFVDGQVPRAIKRRTADFTCSPIDRVLVCDTTAGGFTGTLPAADFSPVEYTFRNVGTNTLTVAAGSGQLIYSSSGAGTATFVVPAGQTLRVQALYNGSSWGWYALQRDALPTTGGTVSGDLTVSGRLSGAIGPYGVIAPSRTGPTWRRASTSFTFQAGHGWTASGAASSNLNNTASPVRGTQYASITTDTAGTSANLRKFGMSAMDLTDKAIRLICRIDDVTKLATLNFFAGTSSLANNFKWTLWETSGASQLGSSGEWITLTFGWASLNNASGAYSVSSSGVPSTTSGFTDLEVQAIGTAGNAVTLDVQAVEIIDATSTTFPNGVVSIVFDDGADSIWNYARPAMDTYGFQGTNYVIVGNLGQSSYMTSAQSKQLQDFSGWEIGLHSYDATMHNNRYTTYTAQQVDDDIRLGKQWLVQNGFRGESIAYPGGEYQKTTDGTGIDSIAARYFSTGRTILFQTGYPTETFPAGMPMRMRAVSSISSTQVGANNPANLVAAGGLLDKCQLNGGWLVLVFHKITVGAATVATECSQSDFQLIMAGINSRGIPVVPVSDVQRLYE